MFYCRTEHHICHTAHRTDAATDHKQTDGKAKGARERAQVTGDNQTREERSAKYGAFLFRLFRLLQRFRFSVFVSLFSFTYLAEIAGELGFPNSESAAQVTQTGIHAQTCT